MSYFNTTNTQSMVETIARTGQWQGKDAYIIEILGNRAGNYNSTTILHGIVEFLGTGEYAYEKPDSSTTFVVSSSSILDNITGIGARQVKIAYLDLNGDRQSTTINLNGTTPVSVAAMDNDCSFVEYMNVVDWGSGANTVALGDIILTNTAETVPYEQISANGNQSLSARYMIPANYTGYITYWAKGTTDAGFVGQDFDSRLRANVDKTDRTIILDGFLFQNISNLGADSNSDTIKSYISIPGGAEVKVSSRPSDTGTASFNTEFTLVVIAN